jgi:NADH-quinone oxidoreductase subunit L
MDSNLHLWILPALPLVGAAINGFFGKGRSRSFIGGVACTTVGIAFLYAVYLFFTVAFTGVSGVVPATSVPYAPKIETLASWISAGSFHADFSFYLDPLSMLMTLVVTGVGFLIHVYSTGYMEDEGLYRFFSYLNLFTFFMLTLVLAGNYLLLFVGWEGVGLCSYLLIGFYYLKKSAGDAGKKAFIVNRIGDFGFTLAMLLIIGTAGSLDYPKVFAAFQGAPVESGMGAVTVICLLLMAGACGKSAQVPLYVWLPDAMEGPTPVSALIHAATMVTAGVYMVARSSPLFVKSPMAMETVAVIGCITCIFAATIGLVQTDIKRVLAYSTVSQLGYMFLGCGVGAFSAGVFHLMTHAFFKALLFLGAGSVITAMHHEQDMRNMGGLRKKIPVTFVTMLLACLAIAGIPPFAGFFSKDEILWSAWHSGHPWLWLGGSITAGMTAFYMFRLLFLTFFGEPRSDHAHHAHESPRSMTVPLMVLALLSVIGGWVGVPKALGGRAEIEHYLEHSVEPFPKGFWMVTVGTNNGPVKIPRLEDVAPVPEPENPGEEVLFSIIAVLVGASGISTAYYFYVVKPQTGLKLSEKFHGAYRVLLNKYYVDELYDTLFLKSTTSVSRGLLWHVVDETIIDGAANGVADGARAVGGVARRLQSGLIRSYAAWVVIGAVGALFFMILLWAK